MNDKYEEVKFINKCISEVMNKDQASIVMKYLRNYTCDNCDRFYTNRNPRIKCVLLGVFCSRKCFNKSRVRAGYDSGSDSDPATVEDCRGN